MNRLTLGKVDSVNRSSNIKDKTSQSYDSLLNLISDTHMKDNVKAHIERSNRINKNPCMMIAGAIYYVKHDGDKNPKNIRKNVASVYEFCKNMLFTNDSEHQKLSKRKDEPDIDEILKDIYRCYRCIKFEKVRNEQEVHHYACYDSGGDSSSDDSINDSDSSNSDSNDTSERGTDDEGDNDEGDDDNE
ncbi:unnamed protein product [Sphagnum troendelagicum]